MLWASLYRVVQYWVPQFYTVQNFAEVGTSRLYKEQILHILVEFRLPYCTYTWFHHEIYDCHSGSDGRNRGILKIQRWAYLKYWQLIWYMSVAVTGDKYCIFGDRGHRKVITICGKFAAVSHRICGKQACRIWKICRGKLWSLTMVTKTDGHKPCQRRPYSR